MAHSIDRPTRVRPEVVGAFVASYLLAVRLSEHVWGTLAVPSPFWLPDSILLSALLLTPAEHWWIFLAVVWPIRLTLGATPGTPLWFQLVSILNHSMKAILAAWLLRRFVGRRPASLVGARGGTRPSP